MTTPTIAVTCRASGQNGTSMSGATFTFRLNKVERYNGLVVPQYLNVTTDASGTVVANLFPNGLGENGSAYSVTGRDSSGVRFLEALAVVPNAPCNLEDALVSTSYIGVSDVMGTSRIEAQASIDADVEAVDESRIAAQSEMALDVTAVDDARIAAQVAMALDVTAVDDSRIAAQSAITANVNAVQDARDTAVVETIPGIVGDVVDAKNTAIDEISDKVALVDAAVAATYVGQAGASATTAAASAATATTARDSAQVNAKGADTIADARALVADGETFNVYASGALTFQAYRRLSSTTQVLLGEYPSAQAVDILRIPGQNLFDKNQTFLANTHLSAAGLPEYNVSFFESLSDFVPVIASSDYCHNDSGNIKFAQYDAAKAFISGTIASVSRSGKITTSSTAAFVRIEVLPSSFATLMLEKASKYSTQYVPYVESFNQEFIDVDGLINDSEFSANVPKITYGKNLFNKNALVANKSFQSTTGLEVASTERGLTGFVRILPSTLYATNASVNIEVAFYGSRKEFISANFFFNSTGAMTTPSGAAYARFAPYTSGVSVELLQIEQGSAFTYFETYAEHYQGALDRRSVNAALGWANNRLSIPSRQYFLTGKQNNIYYQAVQRRFVPNLFFTRVTGNSFINRSRLARLTPASAVTFNYGVRLSDAEFNVIDTKITSCIVSSHTTPTTPCKLLGIGDSQTFGGEWLGTVVASIPNVTTHGIRTGAQAGYTSINHEGRSGWTLDNLFTRFSTFDVGGSGLGFTPFMHPNDSRRYMGNTQTWKAVAATPNEANVIGMTGIYATLGIDSSGRPTKDPGSSSLAAGAVVYNKDLSTWQEWDGGAWNNISAPTMAFNFARYLTAFGVQLPNIVTVMLGTNGFRGNVHVPTVFAGFKTQMDTLIASCIAAGVSKVGVMIPPTTVGSMENADNAFTRFDDAKLFEFRELLIAEYDNRTGSNIFIVDAGSAVDPDYAFADAPAELPFAEYTGTARITPQTNTPHPSTQGYMQMATRVAGFIQAVR